MANEEKDLKKDMPKLPPLDQVPDEKPLPQLKRKPTRVDQAATEAPALSPWLLMEGGDDEICAMPPGEVFDNLELCNRGVEEFGRQAAILHSRLEDIKKALLRISNISQLLSRHQARLQALNPQDPSAAVKAFQRRSMEKKLKVMEKVKNLTEGGANIKELQKALTMGSPLDNAMRRPGGFGNKRPAPMPLKRASV